MSSSLGDIDAPHSLLQIGFAQNIGPSEGDGCTRDNARELEGQIDGFVGESWRNM